MMVYSVQSSLDRRWDQAIKTFSNGDKAGALFIFKALAKDGELAAFREIGNIYEFGGGGVEKDIKEAINWYDKSVDYANDGYACIGLARIYFYGKQGKPDYSKVLWYLSLVENNNLPLADLLLGKVYRLGKGVKADIKRARKFYERSSSTGNVYAMKELALLEIGCGHYMYGLFLWSKAFVLAVIIGAKNIHDPRLKRC